jgi:uncharacterized membrane protein
LAVPAAADIRLTEKKMRQFSVALGLAVAGGLAVIFRASARQFAFTTIDVPGGHDTHALGINDSGQIVGDFAESGVKTHGYVRSASGTFTTFDVPGYHIHVYGINAGGQIVGDSTASRRVRGYVRSSSGTFSIIDLPGETGTSVIGINADGRIVGYGTGHAYVRSASGTFTTIDVPGGASGSSWDQRGGADRRLDN